MRFEGGMMYFLKLVGKKIVIFGLANKKSVACAIGKVLLEAGAEVFHVVRSEERAAACRKLFPASPVFCCDVEDEANISRVRDEIAAQVGGPMRVLCIPSPSPITPRECSPFTLR